MAVTYKEAGVNIDAGNQFVDEIKSAAKATYRPEVIAGVGGFGALFALKKYRQPVLVSSTDGVGTKLRIAIDLGKYDSIGQDLVAMCVNDIACSGAEPLFFLDYFATGALRPKEHAAIVKGIARACKAIDCALIGGETAEMPGMYHGNDFDLAGFAVGVVERDQIIDGSSISIGNALIGVGSSGFHSNGYSLIRAVCEGLSLHSIIPDSTQTLGDALLTPTQLYSPLVAQLQHSCKLLGIAHITGGGITENLPRILPKTCQAVIHTDRWTLPRMMGHIQTLGKISTDEMRRVFNCGIGLILVVPKEQENEVCDRIRSLKEDAWIIGEIVKRPSGEAGVRYV